jgi:hypothetical protein
MVLAGIQANGDRTPDKNIREYNLLFENFSGADCCGQSRDRARRESERGLSSQGFRDTMVSELGSNN